MSISTSLQFLKLGGSLITDKNRPHTPRLDVLERLAGEIAQARSDHPELRLLLGHGSGSFGHVPGKQYGTRQGVKTSQEWAGFTTVWSEAAALNHLVIAALQQAGLPAIAFPPSASVIAGDGKVTSWDLGPIRAALAHGLLPVVYGDVVFDEVRGGTILSTEDLFAHLARHLQPARLLLAGRDEGVWADFPACTRLIQEITPPQENSLASVLGGSAATDVTGGMISKVHESLALVEVFPDLQILIFSGQTPQNLSKALSGDRVGTLIHQ